jgi:hypothetical protein
MLKRPAHKDFIIPFGMIGGAVIGIAYGFILHLPRTRSALPPADAPAMFVVFLMIIGAAAGGIVGVLVAVIRFVVRFAKTRSR